MARKPKKEPGIEVRELKDGTLSFRVYYSVPGLGQVKGPHPFTTLQAARAFRLKALAAIDAGTWTPDFGRYQEASRDVALGDVWERLSRRKLTTGRWSKGNHDTQESHWRIWIAPYWGQDREVASITRADVDEWRETALSDGKKVQHSVWTLFRQLIDFAMDAELTTLARNPARGMDTSVRKSERKEVYGFELPDVKRYIEAAPPEHRALLALTALAGLRSGEVRGLLRRDIDLENRIVHVRNSVTRYRDGGTYRTEVKAGGKTRSATRDVPMTEGLAEILSEYVRAHPRLPEVLLFQREDGGPLTESRPRQAHLGTLRKMGLLPSGRQWKKLSEAERATYKVPRQHDMRASFATQLAVQNTPMHEAMELMGWSDMKMVLQVYARHFPERRREIMAQFDKAYKEAGTA
ncbi:tyrosine-type recombinase/integrase [Tessaracoccus sp. Y36]